MANSNQTGPLYFPNVRDTLQSCTGLSHHIQNNTGSLTPKFLNLINFSEIVDLKALDTEA